MSAADGSPQQGNTLPTEASVRAKLDRPGALFAADEVRVVVAEIDRLRWQVDDYRRSRNELVERFVGTDHA